MKTTSIKTLPALKPALIPAPKSAPAFILTLKCALALTLLSVFGCSKYEDGPLVSFRSVNNRLQGSYFVELFLINDVDFTSNWIDSCNWSFEFFDDPNTEQIETELLFKGLYYQNDSVKEMSSYSAYWLRNKNGSVELSMIGYKRHEDWTNQYDTIGVFPLSTGANRVFEITRLTADELWLQFEEGNNVYNIHFKE